jgi:transposase
MDPPNHSSTQMSTHQIATRAQAVAYKAAGLPDQQIHILTGLSARTVRSMYQKAISRGFDPQIRPCKVLDEHVKDAPRSGRPTKQTQEAKEEVLQKVRAYRYRREKTRMPITAQLTDARHSISSTAV